jgi:beta-phosphoglucomutase-like phosphatase (HAD superfamily)
VDPARCAVVEDTATGVASAEAAGCQVVAVPSVAPIAPAPRRTVVPSLEQVDLTFLRALMPLG